MMYFPRTISVSSYPGRFAVLAIRKFRLSLLFDNLIDVTEKTGFAEKPPERPLLQGYVETELQP